MSEWWETFGFHSKKDAGDCLKEALRNLKSVEENIMDNPVYDSRKTLVESLRCGMFGALDPLIPAVVPTPPIPEPIYSGVVDSDCCGQSAPPSPYYTFVPKKDITVYELATILNTWRGTPFSLPEKDHDSLDYNTQRHFKLKVPSENPYD